MSVYLDMTPGTSLFSLNMLLTGSTFARYWNIRISQIPCGTSYTGNNPWTRFIKILIKTFWFAAPDNCLQYFTSSVGTFSSFNYKFSDTPTYQHLANQDYTICIRMNQVHPFPFVWWCRGLYFTRWNYFLSKGFCGVCYSVCDHPTDGTHAKPFTLSTEDTVNAVHDALCLTDWLQIPCATDQQSTSEKLSDGTGCVAKICGGAFTAEDAGAAPAPVYSKCHLPVCSWIRPIKETNWFIIPCIARLPQTVRRSFLFEQRRRHSWLNWRHRILS